MQLLETQMHNSFQEKLNQFIENRDSFLLFRKPNTTSVELWSDDKTGEYEFTFRRFDNSEEIKFQTIQVEKIDVDSLEDNIQINLSASKVNESISYNDYINLVSRTIDELNFTLTKKIVLSRIKETDNNGVNLIKTFKNLHKAYPKAYLYLWFTANKEVWIGASPELLLAEENLTINTVSLAGTLPKDENWTEKEINEQQVVTDFIVEKLSDANEIKIDGPHTIDAGFFNHLKSYISANVTSYDEVANILNKLHPTPAVCGMPKEDAKKFILENEGYNRDFYAGYFGYKSPKSSLYFVNLRCAKINSNSVKIYVGGGIMPDSNPEKEWEETELKSKTIGNFLITD